MSVERRCPAGTRGFFLVGLLLAGALTLGAPARGATNAVRGGIGELDNGTLAGGDGTGGAQFTINVVDRALVKEARDLAGQLLPGGAGVAAGQIVYFVLVVDNPTDAPAEDILITDALDETSFTYLPGSLEFAVVPSGTSGNALWNAAWTGLTDAVGAPDDMASAVDTGGGTGADRIAVGAVAGQTNLPAQTPAGSTYAVRFRARVTG